MTLSPRRSLALVTWTVVAAFAVHLALHLVPGDSWILNGVRRIMNVDAERSIPTYLATVLLTGCGLLALWHGRLRRLPWPGWNALALVFVAAGIEEVTAVHEELSRPIRGALDVDGWLRFAWVIPGALVALLVAVALLRPLLALPPRVRRGLVTGAALFLLGALGVELAGGKIYGAAGPESLPYVLISTLEEALEFAGVLVWLRTLLAHLYDVADPPTLRLSGDRERPGAG